MATLATPKGKAPKNPDEAPPAPRKYTKKLLEAEASDLSKSITNSDSSADGSDDAPSDDPQASPKAFALDDLGDFNLSDIENDDDISKLLSSDVEMSDAEEAEEGECEIPAEDQPYKTAAHSATFKNKNTKNNQIYREEQDDINVAKTKSLLDASCSRPEDVTKTLARLSKLGVTVDKPDTFNGNSDDVNFTMWVQSLEDFITNYVKNFQPNILVMTATSFLDGPAKALFKSRSQEVTSLSTLVKLLKDLFAQEHDGFKARDKMSKVTGDTVHEIFTKQLAIQSEVPPGSDLALSKWEECKYLFNALPKTIRTMVMSNPVTKKPYTDRHELLDSALTAEMTLQRMKDMGIEVEDNTPKTTGQEQPWTSAPTKRKDRTEDNTKTDKPRKKQRDYEVPLPRRTAEEKARIKKDGLCLWCLGKGHLLKDCPKYKETKDAKAKK